MDSLQTIWGWQPALYLFLGGLGAGTFLTAGILFLKDRGRHRRALCLGMWFSVICLCVGLLLLVTELINPLRGLMLWQSFSNFTSWMTYGAWLVFAAVIVFGLTALLTTPAVEQALAKRRNEGEAPAKAGGFVRALVIAGMILGVCVAVYTGLLLMNAPGVPLWNTPLLPVLFTVSAFDTGVAAMELFVLFTKEEHADENGKSRAIKFLEKFVLVLVILEAIIVAIFLVSMAGGNSLGGTGSASFAGTAAASVALLTEGPIKWWFWLGFVLPALAVPLFAALIGLRARSGNGVTCVGALCVLFGGCVLRFLVLLAGTHVDYVFDSFLTLLG